MACLSIPTILLHICVYVCAYQIRGYLEFNRGRIRKPVDDGSLLKPNPENFVNIKYKSEGIFSFVEEYRNY